MENENLVYVTFGLSKYEALILIIETLLIFCRQPFRHQEAHLFPTTFTSLEHNIHISGSQLPHPENTTVTDYRHSTVLIVLKQERVALQERKESSFYKKGQASDNKYQITGNR